MSATLPNPLLCGFAFSLIALGISTEVLAKDKQADSEATAENLFAREIAPVLVTRCLGCHGDKDPDGNYSLSDTIKLLKAGDTEKSPITPGDPEQSELFKRITSEDEDLRMPPEGARLNASQVAVVKQWIIEGAKLPQGDAATAVPLVSMLPTQVQGVTPSIIRSQYRFVLWRSQPMVNGSMQLAMAK